MISLIYDLQLNITKNLRFGGWGTTNNLFFKLYKEI